MISKVRIIATKVRKQCEAFVYSEDSSEYDFHEQANLDCMCAVASFALAYVLRKNHIKCKM